MPSATELGYTKVNGVWLLDGEPLPLEEVAQMGIADADDFSAVADPDYPDDPTRFEIDRIKVGNDWKDWVAPTSWSPATSVPATQPLAAAPAPGTFGGQGGLGQLALAGRGAVGPGGLPGLMAAAQASRGRPLPPLNGAPAEKSKARQYQEAFDELWGPGAFADAYNANVPGFRATVWKLMAPKEPKEAKALPKLSFEQHQPSGQYFASGSETDPFRAFGGVPDRESLKDYAERLFIAGHEDEAIRVMDVANRLTPLQQQQAALQQRQQVLQENAARQKAGLEHFNLRMQLATSPADAFVVNAMRRGDLPIQQYGGRVGPMSPYLGGDTGASPGQSTQPTSQGIGAIPLGSPAQPALGGVSPEMQPFQAGQAMNTYSLEEVLREQLRQRGGQLPQTFGLVEELGEAGLPPIEQVFGSQPLAQSMQTYGPEAVQREQQRIRGGALAPLGPDQGQALAPELSSLQRMLSGEPIGPAMSIASQAQAQGMPLLMRSAHSRGNLTPTEQGIFRGYLGAIGQPADEFLEEERRATTPGRGLPGLSAQGTIRQSLRRIR